MPTPGGNGTPPAGKVGATGTIGPCGIATPP
jgi:hypothetical protein